MTRKSQGYISQELSKGIVQVIEDYYNHNDMMFLDEIIKKGKRMDVNKDRRKSSIEEKNKYFSFVFSTAVEWK